MTGFRRLFFFVVAFGLLAGMGYAVEINLKKIIHTSAKSSKKTVAVSIAKRCVGNVVELFTSDAGPYQWYDANGPISGATAAVYRPTVNGNYSLQIGTETSNAIAVSFAAPTASFTHTSSNNACGTETVNFTHTGNNGDTYLWNFGDGTTSTEQNPTHVFTSSPGVGTQTFNVSLTVSNSACQSVTSTAQAITLKRTPRVRVTDADPFGGFSNCRNNPTRDNPNYTLTIENASADASDISSYTVEWGDGTTQTGLTNASFPLTHTYTSLNVFQLRVTAYGSNGCANTFTQTVANQSNPAGSFGTDGGTTNLCTPARVPFVISNWENNAPGTTYTIEFGDGATQTFTHPLNATGGPFRYEHVYTRSSCPALTFTARLLVRNACFETPYTAGNIQINVPPTSDFTVSSKIVCQGTAVAFSNATEPGSFNCTNTTATRWDFGDGTTSTANSPTHVYTTPGKYTVRLRTTNTCSTSEKTEEICVNPTPIASFTLPATSSCAPYTLRPTNTSNAPLPNCGSNVYTWTVTRAGTTADCDNLAPFTTQTSSLENPAFNLTEPGVYNVTLSISNPQGTGCTVTSAAQSITIKAPPTAVFDNATIPASICAEGSISPRATVKNCFATDAVSYQWEFPGSSTPTSTLANPNNIVYPTSGTYEIRLRVSNECGASTWYTRNITVYPKPVLNDVANILVCNGATVPSTVFSTSTGAPVTYSWANSNAAIGLAASGTGNLPSFIARNTGTTPLVATITVTPRATTNGSCPGDAKTFTITVSPSVPLANAGADQELCQVNTTTLSGSSAPAGGLWTVVSGTGITFTDASQANTTVNGLVPGNTYVLRWTVQGYAPCVGSNDEVTIRVAPTTVGGTTTGATTYCGPASSGTVNLSGQVGSVVRWESSANGTNWNPISNTTGSLTYTNLATSTYYRAVVKSGGCSEAFSTVTFIEIKPKPAAPTARLNYDYCLNDVATALTATGNDLKWYGALPLSSGSLLPGAPTPSTATAGTVTYYVTQSADGCESDYTTITVRVNPVLSNNVIAADQTICINTAPALLNGAAPSGGSGSYTYQWESSADNVTFTAISGATARNYQPGALGVTTYYRRIAYSGGCSLVSNVVTVNVLGTLGNANIASDQTICYNTTPQELVGQLPTGGTGSFTYVWERSTASASGPFATIAGATGVNYQPASLTLTTYYRRTVRSSSCVAVSNVVTVTVIPQINLTTLPNLVLCNGFAQGSIAITSSLNRPEVSYSWQNSEPAIGLTASGTGDIPAFTTQNTLKRPLVATITYSGRYTQLPLVCEATPRTFSLTVLPTIAITTALPDQTLCAGQNSAAIPLASDAETFAGATVSYRWSSSAAIGLANGQGAAIPAFTALNNGNSPITSTITVVPLYTYSGRTCEGTPKSYQVTVNPTARVDFSIANQTICSNTATAAVSLSSTTPNVTFAWTAQAVAGITGLTTSGTNEIPVQTLVNTTNAPITVVYRAKASTQGNAVCEGLEAEYRITVNPIPVVTASETLKTICSNQNTNITLSSNVVGTQFAWTVSANANVTGALSGSGNTINQTLVNTSTTPQVVTYTVVPAFANGQVVCNGSALTIEVTVNPSPMVTFSTNSAALCSGETSVPVSLSSTTPNAQLSWTVTVPAGITGLTTTTGSTTIPAETLVNTTNSPLTIIYRAVARTNDASACAGVAAEYRLTVNPRPRLTNTVLAQSVCNGASTTAVVLQSNVAVATFSWTATASSADVTGFLASGNGNIPAQTLVNNSTEVQRVTYVISTTAYGCNSTTTTSYEITVYPTPIFTSSTATTEICSGAMFNYTPTSATPGVTFIWTRAAVPGISNAAASGTGVDAAGSIREALINTTVNTIDVVYEYQMSINGCTTGARIPIVVKVTPQVTSNFGLSANSGCSPFNLVISNLNSRALNSSYIVDFGDGSPLETYTDTRDITHTYINDSGQTRLFYITITTRNECGETVSRPYEIRVQPQTVFSRLVLDATQTFGCAPFLVNFTAANQSTGANLFTWDFGDGSPIRQTRTVNENLTHTYLAAGTYTVTLTATNGCSTVTSTEQITVYPQVSTNFSVDKPQDCVGAEFRFTNLSDPQFSSLWDFGDGTTSTEINPTHRYTTPGTKTITLRATQVYANGGSCTAVFSRTVQVLAAPDATFTTNASSLNCGPFTVQTRLTASNVLSVEWDFGDGTSGVTGINASHTYVRAGDYTITAKAYNAQGCTSTSTQVVRVSESPIAAFTPSVNQVCGTSGTVSFRNETTYGGADAVNYRWLVNGVPVSAQRDLSHNFVVPTGASLPYQFRVKLEVSNMVGCGTSEEKIIQFAPVPRALFSVAQVRGCAPFSVVVNNQSTYADTYEWYLDGVLVSADLNPNSIVLRDFDRTYSLRLVAKNQYGCTQSEQVVQLSTYPLLRAEFSLASDLSCNGVLDVQITNTSVGATTYTWDYGDGSAPYVGNNPQHRYGRPGIYQLRLTVGNGFCTDTYTREVKVSNAPRAAFLASVLSGCNQLTVRFTNTSVNATSYYWDFGDGSFSTEENPVHQYVFANTPYTVTLTVKNDFDCTDVTTSTQTITVSPPPQAVIDISPSKITKVPDYSFNFNAITNEDIIGYRWDFGDGSTSDSRQVTHKYDRYGTYIIKLHITNRSNCTNIIEDAVTIIDFPGYLYIPNAFEPENRNNDLKVFKVKANGLATYHLKIFNKWGQLIWQTNKLDQDGVPTEYWDGTSAGRPLPLGAYYWQAEATYINGGVWKGMKYGNKTESKTGVIHLIR